LEVLSWVEAPGCEQNELTGNVELLQQGTPFVFAQDGREELITDRRRDIGDFLGCQRKAVDGVFTGGVRGNQPQVSLLQPACLREVIVSEFICGQINFLIQQWNQVIENNGSAVNRLGSGHRGNGASTRAFEHAADQYDVRVQRAQKLLAHDF